MNNRYHWFLFSFVLAIFVSVEPLYLFWLDEGTESASLVLVFTVTVALLLLLIAFLASLPFKRHWPIFISTFIVFSLLELKFIYFDWMSEFLNASLTLAFIAVSALIYSCIMHVKAFERPHLALYVISFAVFVAAPMTAKIPEVTQAEPSDAEIRFLDELSRIEFHEKPNIYILSYDSMIPPHTARKYLGIKNLPYDSVLKKHFINLAPSAVMSIPTGPSLESLMRMDQENSPMGFGYFSGRKESPLVKLFKSNGYRVTTGYTTQYFGEMGPYIDRYIIGKQRPLSKTTQCIDLNNRRLYLRLRAFGVCQAIGEYSSLTHLLGTLVGTEQYSTEDWHATVLNEITSAAQSSQPELKVFYTYRPNGHTRKGYQHSNLLQRETYRKYFLSGAKLLSVILEDMVSAIWSSDPTAIVLVFGDHGAFLSRGLKYDDEPEFVFEDQHLVYTGVMSTKSECTSLKNLSRYSPNYFTPSRVLASIANCLTGDHSLDDLVSFNEPPKLVKLLSDFRG